MEKFEYKFELNLGTEPNDGEDHTEDVLNRFGSDGWELLAVSPCGKDSSYLGFYFKRSLN